MFEAGNMLSQSANNVNDDYCTRHKESSLSQFDPGLHALSSSTMPKPIQASISPRQSFNGRNEFDSSRGLIKLRSNSLQKKTKSIDYSNVWNIKPIDFTMQLYHPRPPKRNSRDAIKPWEYDKYLRKSESSIDTRPPVEVSKNAETRMIEEYLHPDQDSDQEPEEFDTLFRPITPNEDRVLMANKRMGFRAHLGSFKDWKPHDFRGLQPLYGQPDIKTRFEKDPYSIKFLTEHLDQFHFGSQATQDMRTVDPGLQMGEKRRTPDPYYDPRLILPKLPFPNRFHGYTRFRPLDRSVESAYWDRALPKINEKFKMQTQAATQQTTQNTSSLENLVTQSS